VTREKLLDAFEDMDYEQLQRWLSELQRKRRLYHHRTARAWALIEAPSFDLRKADRIWLGS